jgi:hypothetical protein
METLKMQTVVSLKRWYLPTRLHGVTIQKNKIVIFIAART